MDLRKRFGLTIAEATPDTRIVVVDSVTEVITVAGAAVEPISSLAAADLSHDLRGVVNLDDRLIILINLETLLNTIEDAAPRQQAA